MKKLLRRFICIISVIALMTTFSTHLYVSAFYPHYYFERFTSSFREPDDLKIGQTVSKDFVAKNSSDFNVTHVYRFQISRPSALNIKIRFNRVEIKGKEDQIPEMEYNIYDSRLAEYMPGGVHEYSADCNKTRIMSNEFYFYDTDLSRTVGIFSGNSDFDHQSQKTDILPAGTYYLLLCLHIFGGSDPDSPYRKSSYSVSINCVHYSCTEKTVSNPTCSTNGKIEVVCDSCGETVDSKYVKKLPHTPAKDWQVTAATCAAAGKEELYCTVCNEVIETKVLDALPHTFGDWTVDRETLCAEAGARSRVCSVCGYKETEEIEALPHTFGDWAIDRETSCAAAGERSRVCSVCSYKESEEIKAPEHTYGEWEITKEATCTAEGAQKRVCTVCGFEDKKTIDMQEHSWSDWTVDRETTCTSKGKRTHTCKLCGKSESETVEMLEHDFNAWKTTKEVSESSYGEKTRFCKVCGKQETERIDKLVCGDSFSWEVTKEATCTQSGILSKICDYCGKKLTEKTIPATGHTVKEWSVVKEATPTADGSRRGVCTVCKATVTESYKYEKPKIPARDGFKALREYKNSFADVGSEKWFYAYVETAYEYGLASGTSANRFSPDGRFTVAQALTAAANIHTAYYGKTVGAAKSGEPWYTVYVNYCIENGIIQKNQFSDYDKNITRGDMARIFANILPAEEYEAVRDGAPSDMPTSTTPSVGSQPLYNAVWRLYRAGIVSGDAKTGNYRPNDEISRSEACVIFTRIAVASYRAK